MKQLKDFIHYYIGCRCIIKWESPNGTIYDREGVFLAIDIRDKLPYYLKSEDAAIWTDNIKPILRRLEDMTEEEICEYGKLVGLRTDGVHSVYINYDTPESFHYLLTRHFDLFDLIAAGLAVDAKTLNP
jgi:hypothetical protein